MKTRNSKILVETLEELLGRPWKDINYAFIPETLKMLPKKFLKKGGKDEHFYNFDIALCRINKKSLKTPSGDPTKGDKYQTRAVLKMLLNYVMKNTSKGWVDWTALEERI